MRHWGPWYFTVRPSQPTEACFWRGCAEFITNPIATGRPCGATLLPCFGRRARNSVEASQLPIVHPAVLPTVYNAMPTSTACIKHCDHISKICD